MIDAFNDIELIPLPQKEGKIAGMDYLDRVNAMQVGQGSKVLRVDESGIWLGAKKFANAPFSVDMLGNVIASSLIASGYILVAGAAADVNAGATTISGGKITVNTIDADRIMASNIDVAVDVGTGAGSAYVRLDGVNNRIIVNDGTTNRIVIGNV